MAVPVQISAKYAIIGGPRETGRNRANAVKNPTFGADAATRWLARAQSGSPALTVVRGDGFAGAARALNFADTTTGVANWVAPSYGMSGASTGVPADLLAVIPGERIFGRLAAKVQSLSTGSIPSLTARITYFNGAGAYILDSAAYGEQLAPVTGTWYELTLADTVPSGAAYAGIMLVAAPSVAATVNLRLSRAQLTLAPGSFNPLYIDGDEAGYYWTGTAHDSVSSQDGTRAVLNDETDPDFVGFASDVSGFDGAEIRENFADRVEEDGGLHGEFYRGRRPLTITSQLGGNVTVTTRNLRQARLDAAMQQLRRRGVDAREGRVRWQPTGFPEVYAITRQNQPPRVTGLQVKEKLLSMVAADPRIYSVQKKSGLLVPSGSGSAGRSYDRSYNINFDWAPSRGSMVLTNAGDATAPVILTLRGPLSTPAIQNVTTGEEIALSGSLLSTDVLVIDTLAKSAILNGVDNVYDWVELSRSFWWGLAPGPNTIQVLANSYTVPNAELLAEYEDAWA